MNPKRAYRTFSELQAAHDNAEPQSAGIECQECGTVYEPLNDACTCPCCGAENYPEEEDAEPDEPCEPSAEDYRYLT